MQPLLLPGAGEALRERRAAAEVLQPSEDAQLRDDLGRAVGHRRAGQRQPQRVAREAVREPSDRLGALRPRVLAVVRLVEHEPARAAPEEVLALTRDGLVAQDRDVGRRRHAAAPGQQRRRAVRQPAGRLALPQQPQARRAHHDGGERVVGLEGRQRLHRLAEAGLVGQEGAPRLQQVAHARPLERRELALPQAQRQRLGVARPRAAHRLDRLVVLGAHAREDGPGGRGDRDLVQPQELLERLERPRVDRQRAAPALHPRQPAERLAGVLVPEHLEREALLLHGVLDDELGGRRVEPDAQAQRARGRRVVQPGAAQVGEELRGVVVEGQCRLAVGDLARERGEAVGQLARERAHEELADAARAAGRDAPEPVGRDRLQPRADVVVGDELGPAREDVGHVGRDGVVLRDRPLLVVPVEPAPGDRTHRVDEVGAVREGEDDVRLAPDLAQLDVGA